MLVIGVLKLNLGNYLIFVYIVNQKNIVCDNVRNLNMATPAD